MTHSHGDEFEVIRRGEVVESNEKRPYGKDYTELVLCCERPVTVRRSLSCQRCGQEFSYEVDAVLRWEHGYLHRTTERDALERFLTLERQRTSDPDTDSPVSCPHCHTIQGAQAGLLIRLAQIAQWLKR